MKTRFVLTVVVIFCSIAGAKAQGGCDVACTPCTNSPECPTAVLAGVGTVGVAIARRLRK